MSVARTSRFFKFMTVAFVIVIFMILATRQRVSQTVQVNHEPIVHGKLTAPESHQVQTSTTAATQSSNQPVVSQQPEQEPEMIERTENFDDGMPGAYLRLMDPAPVNQSYCKFNYQLPYDMVIGKKDVFFASQLGKTSEYRIVYNVTEPYGIDGVPQVTYATHMTANFAYFIPQLLKHWDGLISIAAYVPDMDSVYFLEQVTQFCYCEPEMNRVSIHLVTSWKTMFSRKDMYFERPEDCFPQDSSKIAVFNDIDDSVSYPINVLRNVARTSALTKYVLLSDVELMPSKSLAAGFLQMVDRYAKANSSKEVFVLPIFEVESTEYVPENKEELMKLSENRKAFYFHQLICEHCQKFPGIDDWLMSLPTGEVKPLKTVKRHTPYHRWEPIFIGTNAEPLYSETLSWEGLQDKMTQDYDYTILDNAFLCHWPGVKREKLLEAEWRSAFVEKNKAEYERIVEGLRRKYKDIPGCQANFTLKNTTKKKKKT